MFRQGRLSDSFVIWNADLAVQSFSLIELQLQLQIEVHIVMLSVLASLHSPSCHAVHVAGLLACGGPEG